MNRSDPKHVKTAWIHRGSTKKEMPWGIEVSWSAFTGMHGKTLFIDKGKRTSLKYHKLKSEVLYIMKGEAEVTYGSELSLEGVVDHELKIDILKEGDTLNIQSGCPYRVKAITDCEIIEVGNHASDSPIRIEDDYGRLIVRKQ